MQKSGARLGYDGRQVAAPAGAAALPDGTDKVAVRPHHLMLRAPDGEAMAVEAVVATTEITGSESFVHLEHGGLRWVALAHGVHRFEPGDRVTVFLDPAGFLMFDAADRLVAAPDGGTRHAAGGA